MTGMISGSSIANVVVGSNNFLYYEQGNPQAVVAPDVYVVVGAPAHLHDTYLLWNEPKGRHGDPRLESHAHIGIAPVLQQHRHVDIAVAVAASFAVAAEQRHGTG